MGANLRLGRIAGVEIGANWSLLIVFALITWSLATAILPSEVRGYRASAYLAVSLLAAVLFFVSLLAHELGHAIVARRNGVAVNEITLWLFGGVAKLSGDVTTAGKELAIAIVGPAISLAAAAVFALLAAALNSTGTTPLVVALAWLAGINVLLALFNLIPAFPLDGGRVLRGILWKLGMNRQRATTIAAWLGRGFGYLLIGIGLIEFFLGTTLSGIWLAFLGWFLLGAAGAEESSEVMRRALRGIKVADVMSRRPMTAPNTLSVDDFIHRYALQQPFTTFPLQDADGRITGLITLNRLKAVPVESRPVTPLSQVALPLAQVPRARPDEPLADVLGRTGGTEESRILVIDDGHLLGIVSPRDVARLLQVADLRGASPEKPRAAGVADVYPG